MSFARPEILFLIWVVPLMFLIYLLGMKRRQRILDMFATESAQKKITPDSSSKRRWIKAFFLPLVIFFIILSISGPRYGYQWIEIERKGIDIIIALDCSKSMLANDVKPSRLERAKYEIIDLLNMLKGDRVGLVAFSGTSFLQCPLTHDYETFYLFLDSLSPDFMPVGGTNLFEALSTSISAFNPESYSEKAVILITDGESTVGDTVKAAQKAKDSDIKIFSIGIGAKDGAPVVKKDGSFSKDHAGDIILSKLDDKTLKNIARITGGIYVKSVAGDMDLEKIYSKEIRNKMDAATVSSGRKKIWQDRFQWFLGIGLLILMIEMLLPSIKRSHAIKIIILSTLIFNLSASNNAFAEGVSHLIDKGVTAYDKEEYNTALKTFIDAQLKSPDDPFIDFNIGTAYYKSGDYQSALNHFDKAKEAEDEILKHKSYYNKGNSEFRMQQYKKAVESYTKAIELNPDDQKAIANLNLAKKLIEEQKNQSPQEGNENQDQDENNQDKGNPDNQQESNNDTESENTKQESSDSLDDGQGESGDKDSADSQKNDSSKYGDSLDDETKRESQTPNNVDDSQEKHANAMDKSGEEAGKPKGNTHSDDRILDRLEDKPGSALVPKYMNRSVDKDW